MVNDEQKKFKTPLQILNDICQQMQEFKKQRDIEMLKQKKAGATYEAIGKATKLTKQRAFQIINKEKEVMTVVE